MERKYEIIRLENGRWKVKAEGYLMSLSGPEGCSDLATACKLIQDFEEVLNA